LSIIVPVDISAQLVRKGEKKKKLLSEEKGHSVQRHFASSQSRGLRLQGKGRRKEGRRGRKVVGEKRSQSITRSRTPHRIETPCRGEREGGGKKKKKKKKKKGKLEKKKQ